MYVPTLVNPRRACAARVTVVGSVSLCVCLLSHISPMERLFVLKMLSRTQRATKVKRFVGFSLKPLRCRDPALPPLYGHAYSRPFFHAYFSCIYAHDTPPRVQHFSAFHLYNGYTIFTRSINTVAITHCEGIKVSYAVL